MYTRGTFLAQTCTGPMVLPSFALQMPTICFLTLLLIPHKLLISSFLLINSFADVLEVCERQDCLPGVEDH